MFVRGKRLGVLPAETGLWCRGVACFRSKCSVEYLLDARTAGTLGNAPSCAWKDEKTVTVVFGPGEAVFVCVSKYGCNWR